MRAILGCLVFLVGCGVPVAELSQLEEPLVAPVCHTVKDIRVGMSESQVRACVGNPCQIDSDSSGFRAWIYYSMQCPLWSAPPAAGAEEWVFSFRSGAVIDLCHGVSDISTRSCGASLPR